jgi:N-glycosylase/DNA lyase
MMKAIIEKINFVKRSNVKDLVDKRLKEFESLKECRDSSFSELCFCIMTANFRADKCIYIQERLRDEFFVATREELEKKLKELGHRFWPQRAERIVLARDVMDELFFMFDKSDSEIRDFIVKNVKGVGMKEASHFLRNIGFFDVAIIDFHIIDLLVREGLINRPRGITRKVYLEIEEILRDLAKRVGMSLGELDLYLWYLETGNVLK